MPAIEISTLIHTAVLWPAASPPDEFGQFQVSDTPVEIKCRWVEAQSEALDSEGNTITIDASALVAQDIEVGSILWKGYLANWPSNTKPGTTVPKAKLLMEVKTFALGDDLKGRSALRIVGMIRYRNTLPSSPS